MSIGSALRKISKFEKSLEKSSKKSLKSKAVYRRGPPIGSSYNIHKQLEPADTYEDEPARYYKKIYKQEKKQFYFK